MIIASNDNIEYYIKNKNRQQTSNNRRIKNKNVRNNNNNKEASHK